MLEFVDKAFNQVSLAIQVPINFARPFAIHARWNHGLRTGFFDYFNKPIGVITFIGDDSFRCKSVNECQCLLRVMFFAAGQDEA